MCGIVALVGSQDAAHLLLEGLRPRPHPLGYGPGRVAVLQTGIIENDRTLREELQAQGVALGSDTAAETLLKSH